MRKIPFLLMLLSIFVITSCNVINPKLQKIQIELENVSDETIENITFHGIDYGTLESGKVSAYQFHEPFYRQTMPYCEGTIDGQKAGNMVGLICFIDESDILKSGKYTIEIDYETTEEGQANLSLKFKE